MSRKKMMLKALLEEVKKDFLIDLEVGQFFETINTVFPKEEVPKEEIPPAKPNIGVIIVLVIALLALVGLLIYRRKKGY